MKVLTRLALGFAAAVCVAAAGTASQASTPALKRNGLIAFVSNRLPDRGGEIFTVTAAGKARRDLSRSPSPDSDPVVSPEGRRIAFFSSRAKSGLYVANVDGTALRRIAVTRGDPESTGGIVWSRDGRTLVFGAAGGVFRVQARGGGLRRLGNGIFPSWSADGTKIAFIRSGREARNQVVVVRRDGRHLWSRPGTMPVWSPRGALLAYTSFGGPAGSSSTIADAQGRRLARFRGEFQSWSPNGKRIAFWRGDQYALYVAAANGRRVRRVSAGANTAAWAPGSDRLAFGGKVGNRHGAWVYDLRRGAARRLSSVPLVVAWSPSRSRILVRTENLVYAVGAGGSGLRLVARPTAGSTMASASWARRGRSIVYRQESQSAGELYTIQPTGGAVRRLTRNGREKGTPAWSPGGRAVAFSEADVVGRCHGCNYEIAVTDARGAEMLSIQGRYAFSPTWAPDGERIAFYQDSDEGPRITVWDGQTETMIAGGYRPTWSPDGQRIAFVSNAGGLATVRPDGSDLRAVLGGPVEVPAWSPDGARIGFLRGGSIWTVRPDGTGLAQLLQVEAESFAWSPDGTSVVLSRRGDLYVAALDGSSTRRLTSGDAFDNQPTWQPLPAA